MYNMCIYHKVGNMNAVSLTRTKCNKSVYNRLLQGNKTWNY